MGAITDLDVPEVESYEVGALERLRDPASTIQMAAQLLCGPLRPALDAAGAVPSTVGSVLDALERASAQLQALLDQHGAANSPTPRGFVRGPGVAMLLDDLASEACARAPFEAHVEVSVHDMLRPSVSADHLSVALSGLLDEAIEASERACPSFLPSISLRASLQVIESLNPARNVVFEIHDQADRLPETLCEWLCKPASTPCVAAGPRWRRARKVVEDAGGWIGWIREDEGNRVLLCFPDH